MATKQQSSQTMWDSAVSSNVLQQAFLKGLLQMLPSTRTEADIEAFIVAIQLAGFSLGQVLDGALLASKLFGPVVLGEDASSAAAPVPYPIESRDVPALAAWITVQRIYTGEGVYPDDAVAHQACAEVIRQQLASGMWGNSARFTPAEQE